MDASCAEARAEAKEKQAPTITVQAIMEPMAFLDTDLFFLSGKETHSGGERCTDNDKICGAGAWTMEFQTEWDWVRTTSL
jgi:hypothetical protein